MVYVYLCVRVPVITHSCRNHRRILGVLLYLQLPLLRQGLSLELGRQPAYKLQ